MVEGGRWRWRPSGSGASRGGRVVAVLCGANVSAERLRSVL